MQNFIEKNIENLLIDGLKQLGYEIVRVKLFDAENKTLQIMIERIDRTPITVEDCEKVSYHVSPILDLEDLIRDEYNLEVSSPGIERPLVKLKDFQEYIGFEIKFKTLSPLQGSKKFSGRIISIQNQLIEIRLPNSKDSLYVNYDLIDKAHLIFSDELLTKTKH
jgi:ribosome maturation factor RimP